MSAGGLAATLQFTSATTSAAATDASVAAVGVAAGGKLKSGMAAAASVAARAFQNATNGTEAAAKPTELGHTQTSRCGTA
ncbi:Aste57867_13233 [Aphanomyces stellatus]|uniref:Aste57867_13233 protein n=1 Tax=Aphanomyces stellatus TaxID=120398 RepID=A0A485KXL5_9STRA|nr:hypothetical protein As57867_013184 [Aphanomyces stellatus]VFT90073.1 Aste57867_13233 [Aphanomyces stellatus]